MVRYYIPFGNLSAFVEAKALFGSNKDKFEGTFEEEDTYSILHYGGAAGIAIPIGQKVTFDLALGYRSTTVKAKEDNDDDNRVVLGTFGLNLGVSVYLGK